jgi:hypothetical protein
MNHLLGMADPFFVRRILFFDIVFIDWVYSSLSRGILFLRLQDDLHRFTGRGVYRSGLIQ